MNEFHKYPLADIESTEIKGPKERRRELLKKYLPLKEEYDQLSAERPYRYDYLWKNLDQLGDYLRLAELAEQQIQLLEEMNNLRPDSELPLVYKGSESTSQLQVIINHNQTKGRNEQLQVMIAQYCNRFPSWDRNRLPDSNGMESQFARWEELEDVFSDFEIKDQEGSVTEKRSGKNMRQMVSRYLQEGERKGRLTSDLIKEIKDRRAAVEGDELFFSYYESPEDVQPILEEERILNLFELAGDTQEQRKKSLRSLDEVKQDRSAVEQALGWKEGEPVYHLLLERGADRPQDNYGPVRFVFRFNDLAPHSTFTIGDSLNSGGVPPAIKESIVVDKVRDAQRRQVGTKHLILAKALFELAAEQSKISSPLTYIEAQVGGLNGKELFSRLERITTATTRVDPIPGAVETNLIEFGNRKGIPVKIAK